MLGIPSTYVAVAELIMAAGIIVSWAPHAKGVAQKEGYPVGWDKRTKSIFWADMLLILVLLLAAVMLFKGSPNGIKLSLLASGMLLFLSLMVISYNVQNRMYSAEIGGSFQVAEDIIMAAITCFISFGSYGLHIG